MFLNLTCRNAGKQEKIGYHYNYCAASGFTSRDRLS